MIFPRHIRFMLAGLVAVAAAATVWLLLAVVHPSDGRASAGTVSTAGFPSGPGDPGIFTERCRFSHEAADDPILDPGRPGASMRHDFFGNTMTDAASTAASLRGGATTCQTSADASAYWIPVLSRDGKAITPRSALIYWRRARRDTTPVHDMPAGLQMIAGDESADHPQGKDRIVWSCVRRGEGASDTSAVPHSCTGGGSIKLTIIFPSCWDGHTLSATGQTDVVYRGPGDAACPASHPVQIPQIIFHVIYRTSDAKGLQLSMSPTMDGSTDTAHADFVNGWNQDDLDRDTQACIATQTRCGAVPGPTATPRGPSRRELRRLRAQPRRRAARDPRPATPGRA